MDVFRIIYVYTYMNNNNRGHEFKRYKEIVEGKKGRGRYNYINLKN